MNTNKFIYDTLSPEHTIIIGRAIGLQLVAETAVMLSGDLGSGKTTFVKGLADGLEIPDAKYVNSPTYNLINQYSGRFTVHHVDLYRLNDSANLDDIGLGEILASEGVTIVEWPEKISNKDVPTSCLYVNFKVTGDFERRITITCYGFDLALY